MNQTPTPNAGRHVSPRGLAFIKAEEGMVLEPYRDQVGKLTIGIGHLVQPGETFPPRISEREALDLLARDVARFERVLGERVPTLLSQNAYDATISFAFNCGASVFLDTGFMRALVSGDFRSAGDEMLRWCKGPGGVVLPVLKARRQRERKLFLTPDDPAPVNVA